MGTIWMGLCWTQLLLAMQRHRELALWETRV